MGSLNVVKSLPNKLADRNTTNGSSKASFGIEASTNSAQEVRVAMPLNPCRMQERRIPNDQGKQTMDVPVPVQASNYPQSNEEAMTSSPTAQAMLLSGMVFAAGATYPVLYNSSMIFGVNKNSHHLMTTFSSNEVLFSPRSLPQGFWFLMSNTLAFVFSMISIFVAICSARGNWSFEVRAVSLLVLLSLFMSYMMMLERLVPNFVVITASGQIFTGFQVFCLYTFSVILLLLVVALMARFLWTYKSVFAFILSRKRCPSGRDGAEIRTNEVDLILN
nr:Ankyrin repeat-containing protein [Ipomoea batatas]